ncbi:hypothetical protein AB6A40_009904 [Gnathostoma spinigerum]|uniref:BHLH domain-containing protein n=1 Tax=Gnathostoma spinigerum TaxID=75299 RepID=A0ABD6ET96_9BILA
MNINSRERKRMHDLNDALDELRQCLPCSQSPNARKMSKINTLMLASNWIRRLSKMNGELQRQLDELRSQQSSTPNWNLTTMNNRSAAMLPIAATPISSQPTIGLLPNPMVSFSLITNHQNSSPPVVGITPIQPCVKAINGLCFCIRCLIANAPTLSTSKSTTNK